MAYKKNSENAPKRSAFSFEKNDKGNDYLKGWLLTKNGLISLFGTPRDKSAKVIETKTGKSVIQMVVTLLNKQMLTKTVVTGWWYVDEKLLRISEFNLVGTVKGSGKTNSGKYVTGSIVRVEKK